MATEDHRLLEQQVEVGEPQPQACGPRSGLRRAIVVAAAAAVACGTAWWTVRSQGHTRLRGDLQVDVGLHVTHKASVDSRCGPVDGTWMLPDVAAFVGVPFAKPPTGARRFMPPEPAACWRGRLDASEYRRPCINFMKEDSRSDERHESEDCLSLDVYVPRDAVGKPDAKLPVVAWIYGGSLIWGSTQSDGDLEKFVHNSIVYDKPFILVAMNYRIGMLGWAALPELADTDPRGVAGNYGLLDQILALQWVQQNIGAFGGDPDRVTLFGQSSGGTSIFGLLAAPQAQGLFSGALSLSGSANISMGRGEKEAQDRRLWLPHTPCAHAAKDELARCLRSADPRKLQWAMPKPYSAWGFEDDFPRAKLHGLGWAALIYVDGVTIDRPILDSYRDGSVRGKSVFLQSMQAEDGREDVAHDLQEAGRYLHHHLDSFGGSARAADDVIEHYLELGRQFAPKGLAGAYAVNAFAADADSTCANLAAAQAVAAGGAKGIYLATLVRGTDGELPYHQADFWEVENFDKPHGSSARACAHASEKRCLDKTVVEDMWLQWLNFFTTGRPEDKFRDFRLPLPGGLYAHGVLGASAEGRLAMRDDWKTGVCWELKERLHIGAPYWWIN